MAIWPGDRVRIGCGAAWVLASSFSIMNSGLGRRRKRRKFEMLGHGNLGQEDQKGFHIRMFKRTIFLRIEFED